MTNRNELWAQTEDLADLIIKAPEIKSYQEAEQQLQSHEQAVRLMMQLRDLQEQIGDFISRKVPEQYYRHLSEEAESLLEQLEKIPEVQHFQSAQSAVNELLQAVSDRLQQAVLEQVIQDERR